MDIWKFLPLLILVSIFLIISVSAPMCWIANEISGVKKEVIQLKLMLGGTTGELESLNKRFNKSSLLKI
jgi:hypothetical protein